MANPYPAINRQPPTANTAKPVEESAKVTEAATVQELWDREMIRDCLYRYCRGIDRADETLLRAVYWPDAIDNHGAYQGSASGFIDWALALLKTVERCVHQVHNILIDHRGDKAAVESSFTALQRQPGEDGSLVECVLAGRYLDRFERRGGEWRIAYRTVVFDWINETPAPAITDAARFRHRQPLGGRWPEDPVYALIGERLVTSNEA